MLTGKRRQKLRLYDTPGKILSLVGHEHTASEFRSLISYLAKNGFKFVSTDDILSGRLPSGRKAWLTFDDGWRSFLELLPVCEEYKVPVTLFIAPNETRRGQVWTNSIMGRVPEGTIRKLYSQPLARRETFVDGVLNEVGNCRMLLEKDELMRLARHPHVTLENHTWSHLSCSHRPVDEVLCEVEKASKEIESWTGRKCRLLCFPFGHYSDEIFAAVQKAGYHPVTCDAGEMDSGEIGRYRNMFRERVSKAENICRALNAWLKVTVPDKEP